jgi:hypothetical protein
MKNIAFVIILVSISAAAYSQNLNKNDIDIFINHYDTLNEMINWHDSDNDEDKWEKYQSAITTLYGATNFENVQRVDALYRSFERQYSNLINCKVPKEMEDAFKYAGWKTNGNQKYWTIHYGYTLLSIQWEIHSFIEMLEEQIKEEVFDEYEREEIEEAMAEIRSEIDPLDKGITKLLGLFNRNDVELIRKNLETLLEIVDD